uniref:Bm8421 n=1 Tax=Setaria digitata TaxID=48799 RepID=A0A915PVT0_9BILA
MKNFHKYLDENKGSKRDNHGVEKTVNKARKLRIKYHELPSKNNTFEENVLRKAESIRSSVAYKKCCRGLNDYEDEHIRIVAGASKSMPSLYSSKNIFRNKKNDYVKSVECLRSKYFSNGSCDSGSWAHKSLSAFSDEEAGVEKADVGVNKFLRNSRKNLHLLRSRSSCGKSNMDAIKQDDVSQPQILTPKSSGALNWLPKREMVSPHVNLIVDDCGSSNACDEIDIKIKQSFSALNNLEMNIDKAARFLQASFSSRLSISSPFEGSITDQPSSSEKYTLEKSFYSNHHFSENAEEITRGKTLGCQLKAHIAYGKNIAEMSQHLRDVRDAFSSQLLSQKCEATDDKISSSNEKYFEDQSSFYATVQQRINKAIQHNSLSNMHKSPRCPLQEQNCDPLDLPVSSLSKMNSVRNVNPSSGVRIDDSEVSVELSSQGVENCDMKMANDSTSAYSIQHDVSHTDGTDSSVVYSTQELCKRKYYAGKTVKALRQFYRDSMLYFAELRKLFCQRRIEDLWKVESEEERIKAACLLLKRKYIDSVHNTMPLKNLIDYHLHETARIQLLNLDLQKQLVLMKYNRKDINFEKFRHGSEKVLLLTKDFEKNNLANELERWELKLRTRSYGFKNEEGRTEKSNSTRSSFSSPLRVLRNIEDVKVRNAPNYNKKLEQLRDELKWKRKEADFLKRAFNKRVMNSDHKENSLRAQIDAHIRYIVETEKDIAQLINLEAGNNDSKGKSVDVSAGNKTNSASKISSAEVTGEEIPSDEVDKNRSDFDSNIQPIIKTSENVENSQFVSFTSNQGSGIDSKHMFSAEKNQSESHAAELSSRCFLTPQKSEQFIEKSLKLNRAEEENLSELVLSESNKSLCFHDDRTVPEDVECKTAHSVECTDSSESVYNETGNFKQDSSKEALLMSTIHPFDASDSHTAKHDEQISSSHLSVLDEQFFTPLPSDIETDNGENADEDVEEGVILHDSSSSFHTTISSPVRDVQTENTVAQLSLTSSSSKPRKFKLMVSPLASSRIPISSRYAASMRHEENSGSTTNSPCTSRTSSIRCVSPLAASLLESLLEDSMTTMLNLEHKQTLIGETPGPCEGHDILTAKLDEKSTDNSWQNDLSYDLSKIPVPQDLIPGLDLSDVHNAEVEIAADKNDFPSKLEEPNTFVETISDVQLKSPMSVASTQIKFYLCDKNWVIAEIHWTSEQIWNLACSGRPLEIVISENPSESSSQEVQMRQMIADRCCEIARRCFEVVGRHRYMGLENVSCCRPRNQLHLKNILQEQLSKYYENDTRNGKGKKRWETLSRNSNSDIENIVLRELYAEQDSWEDTLENYENEIKDELLAELWHEQLDESLSSIIN